jgi:hypothetical protein
MQLLHADIRIYSLSVKISNLVDIRGTKRRSFRDRSQHKSSSRLLQVGKTKIPTALPVYDAETEQRASCLASRGRILPVALLRSSLAWLIV